MITILRFLLGGVFALTLAQLAAAQGVLKVSAIPDEAPTELQRASKFIPTKASNYDGIENAAKSAGLIK